jgi:hypothetical protein
MIVRMAAIREMGQWNDASAAVALCEALRPATETKERSAIARSLMSMRGGDEIDAAIIQSLKTAPAQDKIELISILAKRSSRAAVPALFEETSSPDTADAAFNALGDLAMSEDLPLLLNKLVHLKIPAARPEAESAAAQALLKVKDLNERTRGLEQQLRLTSDVESCCSLLRLLPLCETGQALHEIQTALNDANPKVREAAVRALAEWPNATAWDSLMDVCQRNQNASERALAFNALVRLANEENSRATPALVERYRRLLAMSRSDDERKLLLSALAGAKHPEALSMALPLLADSGVRAEAEIAVKSIAEGIKLEYPKESAEALAHLK